MIKYKINMVKKNNHYFRRFVVYPICFFIGATYCAFSLGSRLPIAARNAGRSIGMGFNYFKVGLRVFTEPAADQANLIVSQYRQGS